MKILSTSQTRELDQMTIKSEPISSLNLMERASKKITSEVLRIYPAPSTDFHIFCGPGNNGGDGLAVARLLDQQDRTVTVYVDESKIGSDEARVNLHRLPKRRYLQVVDTARPFKMPDNGVIVDALFGSGLSRILEGTWKDLVEKLNACELPTISIDIPSGMFGDQMSTGDSILAKHTICLHAPKLGCFFPENDERVGRISIVDIGLHQGSLDKIEVENHLIDSQMVRGFLPSRSKFSHKGTYGHALLICGGYGMVGAAILATRSCHRVGAGKVTLHSPRSANAVIQISSPETIFNADPDIKSFSQCPDLSDYQSIGIGCGIGQNSATIEACKAVIDQTKIPLVIDADALNILSQNKEWLKKLPKGSILTPHPGEYHRLFEKCKNSFQRLSQQRELSKSMGLYIVYKCAHSCITTPKGHAYFNWTGNPGMATAGSGDVLTGIITGLLAQGLDRERAILTSVYLHGAAGDLATIALGSYSVVASDIIDQIGPALKSLVND